MQIEENKANVRAFYETAFEGHPALAVERYVGPRYIQHNPEAANGPEAFIAYVLQLRAKHPQLRLQIKRVFGEDDFVITHAEMFLVPGEPGLALADFFRLEDGKIVEHWDVVQVIPGASANSNGMV
jgi:predicted SnoaL-like aldol condensation-catalyzing enzyme